MKYEEKKFESSFQVLKIILQTETSFSNLLDFLAEQKLENSIADCVLIFIHTVLESAWYAECMAVLQLDPKRVEHFCSWLLDNLPAKTENSLRNSAIQVLGMILFSCPSLTAESIKIIAEFVVKELQLSTTSFCTDASLESLVGLAYNFVVRHRDANRQLIRRGIFLPLIDLWKNKSRRDVSASLLINMIEFEVKKKSSLIHIVKIIFQLCFLLFCFYLFFVESIVGTRYVERSIATFSLNGTIRCTSF